MYRPYLLLLLLLTGCVGRNPWPINPPKPEPVIVERPADHVVSVLQDYVRDMATESAALADKCKTDPAMAEGQLKQLIGEAAKRIRIEHFSKLEARSKAAIGGDKWNNEAAASHMRQVAGEWSEAAELLSK